MTRHRTAPLIAVLAALLLAGSVQAKEEVTYEGRKIFGWVEKGGIPPLGATIKMKLDSGALTSSIHAENVQVERRDGKRWVSFDLELEDQATGKAMHERIERPLHRFVIIRGAAGEERRPVVKLDVCIGNTIYHEQFTLNDRSDMNYPVLLGRRTISHLGFIDVTRTFISEPECDKPKAQADKSAGDREPS